MSPTLGIQGGIGSFCEAAAKKYARSCPDKNFEFVYLYNTETVLDSLAKGAVDQAIFAYENSTGGLVQETQTALQKHPVKKITEIDLPVTHALMTLPEIQLTDITQVQAHPQVFAQCQQNLRQIYPHLQQITGDGKSIDTAYCAQQLNQRKIIPTTAILGNAALADIYGWQIVRENIQDRPDNVTTFWAVSK